MSDLLQQSRRRTKRLAFSCGGVVLLGTAWAIVPPGLPRIETPSVELASHDEEPIKRPPLDVKAFDTPVWTIAAAPTPPTPPAPPPPPPPPLNLQLIGILKEGQEYKAVLYDPDTNKLFVVATGQEALGHKVDRVAADGVTIKDGALVRTLALKTGAGAGGGP